MLFNSTIFILAFLPISWVGFFALGRAEQPTLAVIWLMLVSLFFYGWWNPLYVPLLLGSMAFNYAFARRLAHHRSKLLLTVGIVANVVLLGYYKYAGFLVQTTNGVIGSTFPVPDIVLPLAISFFTFQQIAFLVDAYDNVAEETSIANYAMFITFFPHLIAGPITHHREMLPQFADRRIFRPQPEMIALGITLFLLGLWKKVIFADTLAPWVQPAFAEAAAGHGPELFQAWGAALSYTLQLYFDFSGYTDMAIGIAMMFGIRLPPNFNSPYKSRNIIEYWSRWHMTLTRFLTAYIYNPMTLNLTRARLARGKAGLKRRKTSPGAFANLIAVPTLATMLVSGIWHGAGWQFIAFGGLHGIYLTVNHAWRTVKAHRGWTADRERGPARAISILTTFFCVMLALMFFRAADFHAGLLMVAGMAGAHGAVLPAVFAHVPGVWRIATTIGVEFQPIDLATSEVALLAALLIIVWCTPNGRQWLGRFETALGTEPGRSVGGWLPRWRPNAAWAMAVGCLGFFSLMRALSAAPSEFLYFKF